MPLPQSPHSRGTTQGASGASASHFPSPRSDMPLANGMRPASKASMASPTSDQAEQHHCEQRGRGRGASGGRGAAHRGASWSPAAELAVTVTVALGSRSALLRLSRRTLCAAARASTSLAALSCPAGRRRRCQRPRAAPEQRCIEAVHALARSPREHTHRPSLAGCAYHTLVRPAAQRPLPRGRSASSSPGAFGRPKGAGRAAHVRAPEVGREPGLRVRKVGQLQQLGGAQALLRLRVQARLRARAAAALSGTGLTTSAARTPFGMAGQAHKARADGHWRIRPRECVGGP
jgi:hypothetical protein